MTVNKMMDRFLYFKKFLWSDGFGMINSYVMLLTIHEIRTFSSSARIRFLMIMEAKC